MRTRKLTDPSLQLKLTAWFLATTAAGLLFQFLLVTSELSELAVSLPGEAAKNYEAMAEASRRTLLLSMLVILPLTLGVGVLATFKFVGPVYRFRRFLEAIHRGEKPADCTIRKGDELHGFCQLLNDVTAPLRIQEGENPGSPDSDVRRAG